MPHPSRELLEAFKEEGTRSKPSSALASKFVSEFQSFYPKLLNTALVRAKYVDNVDMKDRIKKISEYFPLKKFPLQGEMLLYIYELLEKPGNINDKSKHQAYTLGCFMEMNQAYYIILDDVLDDGKVRSNVPCWHLLPDASTLAINDDTMLRSFINEILEQNLDKSIYSKIMDIANEICLRTEMAEEMDLRVQVQKDYTKFTMSTFYIAQTFKASYYALIAPIQMALVLSNKASEKSFQVVEDLCTDLGVLIQINNDFTEYLDATKSISTSKSCTDIPLGKCSWLAVTALQRCTAEQHKVFEENYGSWKPERINRIVQLYNDLNMTKLYTEDKISRYEVFLRKVNNLPKDAVPSPEIFRNLFNYFRSYIDNSSRYYYI